MLPGSCRYYPTCSEYAKWQFIFNPPHIALGLSTARIFRCNQLFAGGIDYPVVRYKPNDSQSLLKPKANYGKIKILYWLVPKSKNRYFVIKDFDGTTTPITT
jgi:putative membrane protein insertion efficiency factor